MFSSMEYPEVRGFRETANNVVAIDQYPRLLRRVAQVHADYLSGRFMMRAQSVLFVARRGRNQCGASAPGETVR